MANYCWVCGVIHFTSPAGWLPVHRDQLGAQFLVTSMGKRYQKGKTNRDFTEARDSEWQWHQLGHMLVCTSLQTDNHASTPPLSFLQDGCSSCRLTNSVKALKAMQDIIKINLIHIYTNIFCFKMSKNILTHWKHGKPSLLWRCWLGGRMGIQPVKNWVMGWWHGYLSGASCRLANSPAIATATHCLLLQ